MFDAQTNQTVPVEGIHARNAIMDTGASYSIIPTKDFEAVKEFLTKFYKVSCTEPKDQSNVSTYQCTCPDFNSLPDI